MKWQLSDGTVVHLGGKVEGESLFARLARDAFERARGGDGPLHDEGPVPGKLVPLDVNDAHHIDVWLSSKAACLGVSVVTSPDVPAVQGKPVDTAGLPILL